MVHYRMIQVLILTNPGDHERFGSTRQLLCTELDGRRSEVQNIQQMIRMNFCIFIINLI